MAAFNWKGARSLTGGGEGALDRFDGAYLSNDDAAVVITSGAVYFYNLDADSALPEDSPNVIAPDSNAGDKRWINVFTAEVATAKREGFTATEDQKLFTLASTYMRNSNHLLVYKNGELVPSSEVTETSTSSFTLADGCIAGDYVESLSVNLQALADLTAAVTAAQAAQTAAETAQNLAEVAQVAAELAETNAAASEVAAAASAVAAAASAAAAAASAASINLPAIAGGDAGKILQVNVGETGYNLVTGLATFEAADATIAKTGAENLFTKQQAFDIATLTSSGNAIAWDLDDEQVATFTQNENTTITPSNMKSGGYYGLKIIGDGSSTLAFAATFDFGSFGTPSTPASAKEISMTFDSDGTNLRLIGIWEEQ